MDESRQVMDDFWNARISRNRFSNLCNVGFGAAMSGMYLLGVCWCAYGILTHRMSFGTLTAITQLIGQIQAPFANLTGVVPRYYSMIASAERLREAEALPDRSEATIPLSSVLQLYRERFAALVLDGVSYAYYPPAEKPEELDKSSMPLALNDLRLRLSKGEITALTGPSGCGKSTALKLLMGVYPPDEGRVLLQDKEGNTEPVSEAWRRLFAYVRPCPMTTPPSAAPSSSPVPTALSPNWKTVWTRLSASAARVCPRDSCSGWPWRAPSFPRARSCSSTRPPALSTPRPKNSCWKTSAA